MDNIQQAKKAARELASKVRDTEPNQVEASRAIAASLLAHPLVAEATCLCCYVSFRSEVATHVAIGELIAMGKTVCVPWCDGDDLKLCQIQSLDELETGTFGVLEPPGSVRENPARSMTLDHCQLVIVPGLAFTIAGERLGYGKGYYDRLLSQSPATKRVALAYDCQIVTSLPTTERDELMNSILTETGLRSV